MEHSTALFPVFPVLWVRIMAWKQASGNDKHRASDLSASPKKTANTPQLAGPESADDFIGWALLKVPRHHFKFIVQAQKLLRVTTQKQLAAETLQEQHKSGLDGGCILSRQEEPSDLVFCPLFNC